MPRRATRSRQSRRTARIEFAAIEIVGALLPPDVVTRIAAFDLAEQSEEDYGIPPGRKLRDEIARYFQIASAHWDRFRALREGSSNASVQFVLELLGCLGFAEITENEPVELVGRHFPIGRSSHGGAVPVVIVPAASSESRKAGIDDALADLGDGSRRRSATQLLQEYLNADERALWGLASDGCMLRLMRDNASLTRPAWIEIDIEKIFTEGLFSDFSALWLLVHASCFGTGKGAPSECLLERWRERAQTEGTAAREKLRLGVEAALRELGSGFLEDSANGKLRQALHTGDVRRQAFYEELLRFVYRLIFLFAAEDRGLLHAPNATETARKAYERGYSVRRLRERCVKSTSLDRHYDVWGGVRALFEALASGEPRLGIVALGGLFTASHLSLLTDSQISNGRLLKAIWHLTWFRPDGQPMTRVNWRDMQTEELGSVYESLLELIPVVHLDTRTFSFAAGAAAGKGSERKSTGSYYTPDSLVQLLLTTTLDPVLDAAELRNPADPSSEILRLSIIDPACGSGHFLLAAARRAAGRIARQRSPGTPSQETFQHALREVVSNCIYGVDRNPMAVELCKVALWIEALEPGKPLSFLNARIRCGDSLIGIFDYEMLRRGLPDEAFDPLTGDDKDVAKALKRKNELERDGAAASGLFEEFRAPAEISDGAARVLGMPENSLDEIRAKSRAWNRLLWNQKRLSLKSACDMYVAAFLLPKIESELGPGAGEQATKLIPTTHAIWTAARGRQDQSTIGKFCTGIAEANRAFHWPLEFPAAVATGGFDAVVGNPPWERIKLQEQEFFAARDTEITTAPNKAERERLIRALKKEEIGTPKAKLSAEFETAKRASEATSVFVRRTGRFPLAGTGDVNTYALFAEHCARLARSHHHASRTSESRHLCTDTAAVEPFYAGRAGIIIPAGIATDSTTKNLFADLVAGNRLAAVFGFSEVRKWFKDTDDRKSFCIFVIGSHGGAIPVVSGIREINAIYEKERTIPLDVEAFRLFNPNTLTAPLFQTRADHDLTKKVYRTAPVLITERPDHPNGDENPWGISFQRLFDMSNDSAHFCTAQQLLVQGFERDETNWRHEDGRAYVPLYEAKMFHQFDHRFGSYVGLNSRAAGGTLPEVQECEKNNPEFEIEPWYWIREEETDLRLARVPSRLKQYYRKKNGQGCLKVLSEWVVGTVEPENLLPERLARSVPLVEARLRDVLGAPSLDRRTLGSRVPSWLGKIAANAGKMQREFPLSEDDIRFIKEGPSEPLELISALIELRQPRWLMGWRDICRSTDERTIIATVFPKSAAGDKLLILHHARGTRTAPAILANLTSLVLDYVARQKFGGTSFKYYYMKQLPIIGIDQLSETNLAFLARTTLELTYTSYSMRPWAEDLGYFGTPFAHNLERRAKLRGELDAFFARKYGLSRDELRYILDPADTRGERYPSETFRVLKQNEIHRYGEYRTQRLVLEAYDRLTWV